MSVGTGGQFEWDDDVPVLQAEGLKKHFPRESGLIHQLVGGETKHVKAVDGVDLSVGHGETMGVVGESGCGKSTLGEVLVGLQSPTSGTIKFLGQDVSEMDSDQLRAFRRNVQMIFQDPYESLNPRFTVKEWIKEPLDIHGIGDKGRRIYQALERAELTPPEQFVKQTPSELSGGQRQRVAIARALVLEPKFIVADEPVSMLDVSVRASILGLLEDLVEELNMGALYISHDLSLIRQMCKRTSVMYLGKIVEEGPTETITQSPKHPYTRSLIDAVPVPNPDTELTEPQLSGEPPDPVDLPDGCNFRPRCPYAGEVCLQDQYLSDYKDEHDRRAACSRIDEIDAGEVETERSRIQ